MKSIPEQYVELWNTRNIKGLPSLFSESAFYRDALQEGNAREVLAHSIRQTAEAFPDVSFEIVSLTEGTTDNQLFILEWLMQGTPADASIGAEQVNKAVAINGVDLIRVEDKKIVGIKSFYDSTQLIPAV